MQKSESYMLVLLFLQILVFFPCTSCMGPVVAVCTLAFCMYTSKMPMLRYGITKNRVGLFT